MRRWRISLTFREATGGPGPPAGSPARPSQPTAQLPDGAVDAPPYRWRVLEDFVVGPEVEALEAIGPIRIALPAPRSNAPSVPRPSRQWVQDEGLERAQNPGDRQRPLQRVGFHRLKDQPSGGHAEDKRAEQPQKVPEYAQGFCEFNGLPPMAGKGRLECRGFARSGPSRTKVPRACRGIIRAMSVRKQSTQSHKPRRLHGQQLVLTVIGLLVIATFILGMLAR